MPIATFGAALAAPARARMVEALMDGCARSATELALVSGVTPQTASSHLAQLVRAGILGRRRQGRHRFYELAHAEVADALELLEEVVTARTGPRRSLAQSFRTARTCYDHLAGRLGVALTSSLRKKRCLRARGSDFELTRAGRSFFEELGVELEPLVRRRRAFARQCLDCTERQPHLGGALGAALADRCFELGWIRRAPVDRAILVTGSGRRAFRSRFDLAQ